ncbi:MAG: hypothetical protein Tsb0014_46730 [Pleurocapsa sp.]
MTTYLERIEKKVDDLHVSTELINDIETLITQGHQENIFGNKQILETLIDRVWLLELRAKKIGNWSECEYYYRLSCQLREMLNQLNYHQLEVSGS